MTPHKIVDIKVARRRKREKTGWTKEEAVAAARREYEQMIASPHPEPDNITSGNVDRIHEDDDEEEPQ